MHYAVSLKRQLKRDVQSKRRKLESEWMRKSDKQQNKWKPKQNAGLINIKILTLITELSSQAFEN